MYQALRKPGFVVTGWEHVFCRQLLWSWNLLCGWTSACNEDAVLTPDARMRLVTCANALTRVADLMRQQYSADFARVAPYLVAECVAAGLSSRPILPDLKKYLTAFLFKLLDLCDESSTKYLSLTFQSGVHAEVYDKLYEEYLRHGKFVGRV
jgi:hypothetical protein